jgi:hypothetical protein
MVSAASLLALVAGVALAISAPSVTLTSGPTATAQVGVYYSSAFTATNGTLPYSFAIYTGALPTGLNLNTTTGAVTGTPTLAGTYNFQGQVTDSTQLPADSGSPTTGPDSQAAARRRGLAQSGNHAASSYANYSIVVAPAAPSPTPVPPSVWMAVTGLAGAGLFRLRQKRRA